MKEMLKKVNKKVLSVLTAISLVSMSMINAHAEVPDVSTTMGTALTGIQTQTMSAIGVVAPIGLSIMGVFLVWRYGLKFFKSISK